MQQISLPPGSVNQGDSPGGNDWAEGIFRLITDQLGCLLKVVDLETEGKPAGVNSYRWDHHSQAIGAEGQTDARHANNRIVYQCLSSYQYSEPRLQMIERILYLAELFGSFLRDGTPVRVDGFRLKFLHRWARYPAGMPIDSLGPICSFCDARCQFCFRRGSAFQRFAGKMLTLPEAKTRLKYYRPEKETGLPLPLHDTGDIFLNPHLFPILEAVRESDPGWVINDLTTHGNRLTAETMDRLAGLKPIFLVVSLNSANADKRRRIMGGRNSEVGIKAVRLLRERGIPYIGSIVPWPDLGLDDVEASLRYLDRHDPYLIRICLPSFTSFSHQPDPFDGDDYWRQVGQLIDRIRGDLSAPILAQPSWYLRREIRAHVDGVIKNSPAYRSGLRFGDLIVSVDGEAVITRKDAADRLLASYQQGREAEIGVRRESQDLTFHLSDCLTPETDAYPFKPAGYVSDPRLLYGVHFIDGFPVESLLELERIINSTSETDRILIFTTVLGSRLLRQMLFLLLQTGRFHLPLERIRLTIAPHNHWRGNIVVGDLHVVQDYIDRIEELQQNGYHPDLVLIPSSFTIGQWKLDLLGNSYLEIERQTGCRVELVPTPPIKV